MTAATSADRVTVFVRLEGARPQSPNRRRGASLRGIRGQARSDRRLKEDAFVVTCAGIAPFRGRVLVLEELTITRVGPRRMDHDNIVAALKRVLDGVCLAIGVNDRRLILFGDEPGPRLRYAQRLGEYSIEIRLEFTAVRP